MVNIKSMPYNFNTNIDITQLGLPEYLSHFRNKINQNYLIPETKIIPDLINKIHISDNSLNYARQHAVKVIMHAKSYNKINLVQKLMQEFSLSSSEGLSLMCLAESLLRIPDQSTRMALIRDKIKQGDWNTHLENSNITLMYASALGLNIAKKILSASGEEKKSSLGKSLQKVISQFGEPIIHKSIDAAMHLMGNQFVIGESIHEALKNSISKQSSKFLYSYDMLGEAALTSEDSSNFFNAYKNAIDEIGKQTKKSADNLYENNGISIKLSALHPRYTYTQQNRVNHELYEKLLNLVNLAKEYNIGINIDAEECDRLDLSLDLFTLLCSEASLAGWNGLGFVVQAYQKRAYYVLDYLINLAKYTRHKFMIRLVKGAYWDSEIKYAQQEGLNDYPVFTRKYHTDVNYLVCADKILSYPELIYPQFATHNAMTISSVLGFIEQKNYIYPYEFQCLYGMGEQIYTGVLKESKNVKCRIYAPVGSHTTLLPYLVRRLLENGANSSFINQLGVDKNFNDRITNTNKDNSMEEKFNINILLVCPIEQAKSNKILGQPHDNIPNPINLFKDRQNSKGINLGNPDCRIELQNSLNEIFDTKYEIKSILHNFIYPANNQENYKNQDDNSFFENFTSESELPVKFETANPNNINDIVGILEHSSLVQVEHACTQANLYSENWSAYTIEQRTGILLKAADLFETKEYQINFINLLMRESGKTLKNSIAEIREAVDFLRYYSTQITEYKNNVKKLQPLGAVACISPWNFPLAIFIGQISAALACGNTVIAKPAEQTSLIAGLAVELLHKAGVPSYALQLVIGNGEDIGSSLVNNTNIQAVIFTGSLVAAKTIQQDLSRRLNKFGQPVTLIAETGGQNAMIIDSSALPQQAVQDIINSAFDSAGQRCSALRILCIQDDVFEHITNLLQSAMKEFNINSSININADINAVIDRESQQKIQDYIKKFKSSHIVYQTHTQKSINMSNGYFCTPSLIYINSLDELEGEIFGPVLHIIKYKRENLIELIQKINNLSYGLTMGIHSRIEENIQNILQNAHIGNIYINRDMVGAVVGVQPFGGYNLSGTGPKAGGALYLLKLLQDKQENNYIIYNYLKNIQESGDNTIKLEGVTGEINKYSIHLKKNILCIADNALDLKKQIDLVFNMGAYPIILNSQKNRIHGISEADIKLIITVDNIENVKELDAILFEGDNCLEILEIIAQNYKKIIPVITKNKDGSYSLISLFYEKSICINTAASGGNASLMML